MADPLALPSRIELSTVSDLHDVLRKRIGPEDVLVDAGDVTHLGALGLQVLVAAAAAQRLHDAKLLITNISDRVLDQLNTMGMTPETITEGTQ